MLEAAEESDSTNIEPHSSEEAGSHADLASYELLSDGLMGQILPKIRNINDKVDELTKNQSVMVESLQKENEKVAEWNVNEEISIYMAEVKYYRDKLLKIRKDMNQLGTKSARLRQRTEKLRQTKEKEDLKQQELKRRQDEKERSLIAKPATNLPERK